MLAATLTRGRLHQVLVGMVTTGGSQVLTCFGPGDGKSPVKMAGPVEPGCLELWTASGHQLIQLTSLRGCHSRVSTKPVALELSLWAVEKGVLKPGTEATLATVNVTTELC